MQIANMRIKDLVVKDITGDLFLSRVSASDAITAVLNNVSARAGKNILAAQGTHQRIKLPI